MHPQSAVNNWLRGRPVLVKADLRDSCLIAGLLLYGTLSTPFPRNPGLVEVLIGGLLFSYAGVKSAANAMGGYAISTRSPVPAWLYLAFNYLLLVPLLVGVWRQWDLVDVLRDAIPLIYLFIPVVLLPVMLRSTRNWSNTLPMIIAFIGVMLSIRFFVEAGSSPFVVGSTQLFDNFLYLPYDPAVLFAAIYLPLTAIKGGFHITKPLSLFRGLTFVVGGLVALAALASIVQRAPMALVAVSFVFFLMFASRHSMLTAMLGILTLFALHYIFKSQIYLVWDLLLAKQESVGANAKDAELFTVINEVASGLHTTLFGLGWGGVYADPAANGEKVSYTHSLFTYVLLKAGLLGLAAILAYFSFFLTKVWRVFTLGNMPVLLAGGSSLLIGLIFQPSFKVLTYGFIMLAVTYLGFRESRINK